MIQTEKPNELLKSVYVTQPEAIELGRKHRSCTIGIPKETQPYENRVCLTPVAVKQLTQARHKIIFEAGAGKNVKFTDRDYNDAGAVIVYDKKEIYNSDIILKVAPFTNSEIDMLNVGQTIFSSLHLPTQKEHTIRKLMKKRVTAIAFEYIKNQYNHHPIVRAMSELSGSSSIMIAAEYLSNIHEGKGVLLGGFTGITPTEIIIIGAGTASEYAARTALGLGAMVKVFDKSPDRLRELQYNLGQRLFTSYLHPQVLEKSLKTADVVIGAMEINDDDDRYFVSKEMVQLMKAGSVIIDISIDQGGCFETSHFTNHGSPTFKKYNITHYCVPNIASRVARTASIALSDIFGDILLKIGKKGGVVPMLRENIGLRNGVYIYNSILTSSLIGKKFGMTSQNIDLLTATF